MTVLTKTANCAYNKSRVNAYFQEDYTCDFAFWLGVAGLMIGAAALIATGPAGVALIYGFSMSFTLHSVLLGGGCMGYW